MALTINGRMKVKTLKKDFHNEFGLTLRVYDGRCFADNNSTLASIRQGDNKSGEFAPRKNTKVRNLEDKIMQMFGIKTQVAGSDDSYLCNNDLTLAGAYEENTKILARRKKKEMNSNTKPKTGENSTEEVGKNDPKAKSEIAMNSLETLSFFVKDILAKSGEDTENLDDSGNIFKLVSDLKIKVEDSSVYDFFNENEKEEEIFSDRALRIAEHAKDIDELWKYALIFQAIEEDIDVEEALNDIRSKFSNLAESPHDALECFVSSMSQRDLSQPKSADIDYAIGCLCLGIEASLNDGDEAWLENWITGFGNCVEYNNDVAEVLCKLDFEFRDLLLEEYMLFLKHSFQIDTFDENGEFRSEDEGVDWGAVSEEMAGLL